MTWQLNNKERGKERFFLRTSGQEAVLLPHDVRPGETGEYIFLLLWAS